MKTGRLLIVSCAACVQVTTCGPAEEAEYAAAEEDVGAFARAEQLPFGVGDLDEDGTLSPSEVTNLMGRAGIQGTPEFQEAMFAWLDTNQDQMIDRKEWERPDTWIGEIAAFVKIAASDSGHYAIFRDGEDMAATTRATFPQVDPVVEWALKTGEESLCNEQVEITRPHQVICLMCWVEAGEFQSC